MYTEKELVRIAKREKNKKRNYLVVNRLQGKHIPVKPGEALFMFQTLADTFKDAYKEETLLLIGFAETATAIGAAAAIEAGAMYYIQTTREIVPGAEYLLFSEEHSHATEQKLVKDEMDRVIEQIDRIVFLEDEVTTGKTILNMIHILESVYTRKINFSVASLLNGMDEAALKVYQEKKIRLHYLVKTDHSCYARIADSFLGNGKYVPCNINGSMKIEEIKISSGMNARRLVIPEEYKQACMHLWEEIDRRLHNEFFGSVLVLGTEEFMYPALFTANEIEKLGVDAVCHSTTRSPILVSREEAYPLHIRYELKSMYDRNRTIYVYDIDAYDTVLILSDSQSTETEGICSLVNALSIKNNKIFFIRWIAA